MDESYKILLVDDDIVDRMASRRALRAAGMDLDIAEADDAATALAALESDEMDCVILDYQLPDCDGLSLVRRVRSAGIATPIIVLTAHGDEVIAVELMKAGASDYLSKSRLTPHVLARSLRHAVRVHRAEKQARIVSESLRESEERFRAMADRAPVLLWVADPHRLRTYFNQVWLEFTGCTVEESIGNRWVEGVHSDDLDSSIGTYARSFNAREPYEIEYRLKRHDGEYRWILERGNPRFTPTGRFEGYIGSCIDITERKLAVEELVQKQSHIAALNEKLKRSMMETHHRVKNNLQIVAAMVDMQAMDENRTITAEDMKQLGSHIHTLAVVHEMLTQEAREDGQAESISASAMLGSLMPLLQKMAGGRPIQFDAEDARLSAKQGTSLALVTNELVSNGVKYGDGPIEVRFHVSDGRGVLEVRDHGQGFPENFDAKQSANTGLELVGSLAAWDLGGSIVYENAPDGGARVRVSVPLTEARDG